MLDLTVPTTTFNPVQTGRIAIAIAIAALVSIITLALLYSNLPIFGPINDVTNAVGGLLSAFLIWQFHVLLREYAPRTATLFLLVGWAGSAAIIINSLLVAFGQLHWMTGGMYTAIGFGLHGICLLALLRLIGPQPFLTPGLVRLGTVAAVSMLFGLLAGPLLAAGTSLTASPLVWVAYLGAGAGWLLYPVWCLLLGWRLGAG